jgi:glycosyltransferase involved in cell wall biosynthesis
MKICYFGIYNPEYSRNRIFIKGLKKNGAEVIECVSAKTGIKKYFDLISQHRKIRNKYDVMIVGFPGQQSAILARFLTRKPIIFDSLVSLYDSLVYDRKNVGRYSFGSAYFWFIDWFSLRLTTAILVDTEEHAKYFSKEFHIRKNKFHRIFIGSDDEFVNPCDKKEKNESDMFIIHFHGFFNPLQGVPYIIGAAKLLEKENMRFNIIGRGQGYEEIRKLANNIRNLHFIHPVLHEKLKEYIGVADVCLGVFGESAKTKRVIPNKVFESLAANRPLITSRTEGIQELLTDKENVLLCNVSDSADLAKKILELKTDDNLRQSIAKNGYKLFLEKLKPEILGKELLELVESVKIKK